jgi:hypothetical protein
MSNPNEFYIVHMLSELYALLNNPYDTRTSNTNRRIHSYTLCDFCKKNPIEGDRYYCTICDDYDLCSKCFRSGRFNKSHQPILAIKYTNNENAI